MINNYYKIPPPYTAWSDYYRFLHSTKPPNNICSPEHGWRRWQIKGWQSTSWSVFRQDSRNTYNIALTWSPNSITHTKWGQNAS